MASHWRVPVTVSHLTYPFGILPVKGQDDYDYGFAFAMYDGEFRFFSEHDSTMTLVKLTLPDIEYFGQDPSPYPSEGQLRRHREFIDTFDTCVSFLIGVTVQSRLQDPRTPYEISSDHEAHFRQIGDQIGKEQSSILSVSGRLPIENSLKCDHKLVVDLGHMFIQSIINANLSKILRYWRSSIVDHKFALIELFKAFELIRRDHEHELELETTKAERKYLGMYPQLIRHDHSDVQAVERKGELAAIFPKEMEAQEEAIVTYKAIMRKIVRQIALLEVGV